MYITEYVAPRSTHVANIFLLVLVMYPLTITSAYSQKMMRRPWLRVSVSRKMPYEMMMVLHYADMTPDVRSAPTIPSPTKTFQGMKTSHSSSPRDPPGAICGYQYPVKINEISINKKTCYSIPHLSLALLPATPSSSHQPPPAPSPLTKPFPFC